MQMMTEPKTGTRMEPMVQVFKLVVILYEEQKRDD